MEAVLRSAASGWGGETVVPGRLGGAAVAVAMSFLSGGAAGDFSKPMASSMTQTAPVRETPERRGGRPHERSEEAKASS